MLIKYACPKLLKELVDKRICCCATFHYCGVRAVAQGANINLFVAKKYDMTKFMHGCVNKFSVFPIFVVRIIKTNNPLTGSVVIWAAAIFVC